MNIILCFIINYYCIGFIKPNLCNIIPCDKVGAEAMEAEESIEDQDHDVKSNNNTTEAKEAAGDESIHLIGEGGVAVSGAELQPETLESLAIQFPNTQFLIVE